MSMRRWRAARPLAEIDHAFEELKLRGLYFSVDSLSRHGFPWPLDAPQMEPFWDKLARRGIVLCIEFSSGPSYDKAGYMAHIAAFGRVLDRHPGLRVHLAMSPPVGFFARTAATSSLTSCCASTATSRSCWR